MAILTYDSCLFVLLPQPANIMFNMDDGPASPKAGGLHVRAVDFGSSRVTKRGQPLTHCGGTPLYMAPEMALQRYGVGVDVWAAGVLVSIMWSELCHLVKRLMLPVAVLMLP